MLGKHTFAYVCFPNRGLFSLERLYRPCQLSRSYYSLKLGGVAVPVLAESF